MSTCENLRAPCQNLSDYAPFDKVCRAELVAPVTVNDIVNQSSFCTSIILDLPDDLKGFDLTVHEYLKTVKDREGVYHLWVEDEYCSIHDIHSLICAYVGKGETIKRVKDHIKKKWPEAETVYISFYECENRISKYLEQLFLDTYQFELNTAENTGTRTLYARWDDHRFCNGTETQEQGEALIAKNREFFAEWVDVDKVLGKNQ